MDTGKESIRITIALGWIATCVAIQAFTFENSEIWYGLKILMGASILSFFMYIVVVTFLYAGEHANFLAMETSVTQKKVNIAFGIAATSVGASLVAAGAAFTVTAISDSKYTSLAVLALGLLLSVYPLLVPDKYNYAYFLVRLHKRHHKSQPTERSEIES